MARILKYNEAKLKIAEIISDRRLKMGDKLPPEREFAEMLGVSIISVRRAIEEFQAVGIVRKVQGVGTFLAGELDSREYSSKLGIVSICDSGFPSGAEMARLRVALEKRHADYAVFAVNRELMPSLAGRLAECDRFIVSGFVTPAWLDYLGNQGKRIVEIGSVAHATPVCRVMFDWQKAFEGAVDRLAKKGTERFGMLLVNSNSASCSPVRRKLFTDVLSRKRLELREERILEVDPARPFANIRDYFSQHGPNLDILLVDYHVFSFLAIGRLLHDFPLPPKVVVMQTERTLPDEFSGGERFGELFFPECIIEEAVKVLYDLPCSFVLSHETCGLEPRFTGNIFQS